MDKRNRWSRRYIIEIREVCSVCPTPRAGGRGCDNGPLLKTYELEASSTTEAREAALLHFQIDCPKATGLIMIEDGAYRIGEG